MHRRSRAAALAALSLTLCLTLLAGLSAPPAQGQAPTAHADLVLDLGDGRMQVSRVPVVSGTTGLSALVASGLELELSGGAVCSIEGLGCPADNCFCACQSGQDCRFWGFHLGQSDGGWQAAEVGAADQPLAPGEVQGWVWGRPAPAPAPFNLRAGLLATQWLSGFQEPSGGLADHVGFTTEAIFAARGVGIPLETIRSEGDRSLVDFLASAAGDYAQTSAAAAGKALAGAVAANLDPRDVGGGNLIAQVQDRYEAGSGWYGPTIWDQSWSILGLAAAGQPIPDPARDALLSATSPAGGWGGVPSAEAPDVDSSAMALQALAAAGLDPETPAIAEALDWLESMRQPDGGFAHDAAAGPTNLNATGLALQALFSLGLDPNSARWTPDRKGPLSYLTSTQQLDGRLLFGDQPSDVPDLVGTLQSVPALTGRGLPIVGYRAAALRGADWLLTQQELDGGFGDLDEVFVAMALAAVGRDANPRSNGGATLREALERRVLADPESGRDALLTLAVVAIGADPRDFAGVDLVDGIMSGYDAETGRFEEAAEPGLGQAHAILALSAAEADIPRLAISTTLAAGHEDGGWGEVSQPADTGAMLQALAAAGVEAEHPWVRAAILYLRSTQQEDGGWGEAPMSTAWATMGLTAMGQRVEGAGWARGIQGALLRQGPMDALLAPQQANGSFDTDNPVDPILHTAVAVLGLSDQALPIVGQPATIGPSPIHLPLLLRGF